MVTPSTRNVLVAFIASPNDVPEERHATRDVIDEVNKILRNSNWQIDVIGWEDTLPGAGRPQELINKDVDACHLFVGILWKRWGTPTTTYSSGFEEEFERVIKRREETGSPEIWLSFKRVDQEFLKDKGEHLQKVLDFKQKQNEQRQVLYQEFTDVEEWKRLLTRWLLEYVLQQISALQHPEMVSNVTTAVPDAGPSDTPSLTEDADIRPAHEQILGMLRSIRSAVEGARPDDFTLGTDKLDPFEIIRNHLLSTALTSLQITDTTLGVREIQRLYIYRERLEPRQVEMILLLRMLIEDSNGLIPGWYWFSWLDEKKLKTTLFDFALRDQNVNVRTRTWELLAAAHIQPVEDAATWDMYLKYMLVDESHVKKAGVSYLGAVGGMRDLPAIKSGLNDPVVSGEATISRLLVLARSNPAQVLSESIPTYYADKSRVISALKANVRNIQSESLLMALRNKDANEAIKFLAIEELKRRRELTSDVASSLLEGSPYKVAEICYRELIGQGKRFPLEDIYSKVGDETYNRQHSRSFILRDPDYADAKSVILEMYSRYSEEDLWELVDWQADFKLGDVAYKALALYHFAAVGSRIRDDLNKDFKSYEKPFIESVMPFWIERFKNSKTSLWPESGSTLYALALGKMRHDQKEEDTPEASAKKEAEGVKSRYIAAALAGLALNGRADDIQYGRKYLSRDEYDVRVEAVAVIDKFGDEDDIQNLTEVAKSTEGVLQESAARAALKLSPDVKETARTLLQAAKEDDLANVVIGHLLNEDTIAMANFLEPLLVDENVIVRRKVVAFFAMKITEEGLENLLKRYTNQAPYYYDVVCWLDRILYAPTQLKEAFTHQLTGELLF